MVKREEYLKQIRGFYDSDLIKVITGIRRCGKSVILNQIIDEIKLKSDNVLFLNFEDMRDFEKAGSANDLINYISSLKKGDEKYYIFLDEIQMLPFWQEAIRTLRLDNNSVFISGSNSKMLSKEFLNELSGRFVSFQIRPFVYKEICSYCAELGKEASVDDYLIWGGFPKRFEFDTENEVKKYLSDVEFTIVFHDLISRYNIRKEVLFIKVVNYILKNNSRIFSAKSIYNYIKNEHYDCSVNTIMKFLFYLKEAFLIEEVPQFSTKAKRELLYYGKLYNMDVAFNSLSAENNRYDIDHNLENIVYNELKFRGFDVKFFNINGKEIDFRCQKDNKTYYIQVAHSVVDDKAYEREFAAFNTLDNQNQKILITTDTIDYSTSTVRHLKLADFLKMQNL